MPFSCKKLFNQVKSRTVFFIARYPTYALEQAPMDCFLLLWVMRLPHIYIYPAQSELEYPSIRNVLRIDKEDHEQEFP